MDESFVSEVGYYGFRDKLARKGIIFIKKTIFQPCPCVRLSANLLKLELFL